MVVRTEHLFAPALARILGMLLAVAALSFGGSRAAAAPSEPILFLGIQRHTAIDRVVSEQLAENLSERGENIHRTATLSDAERRCRHPQCLEALALDHRVPLVLSGDVSSAGPNNTLRVQMRLFDVRRQRGTPDSLIEMENLCTVCDETKLGIVIATTTSGVLASYRTASQSQPPPAMPAVPDAPPPAPGMPPSGLPANPPPAAAPPPVLPSQGGAPPPALLDPASAASTNGQPPQPAPPAYPPEYYNPPPSYPPPAPLSLAVPPPAQAATRQRRPLSSARKGVAAVFGILGFGSLVVAAIMTGLDRKLAPDYSYNPDGKACSAPENVGKACVLSTVGVYAPTYALGGLLVGGMVLTLALPEARPRPPLPENSP